MSTITRENAVEAIKSAIMRQIGMGFDSRKLEEIERIINEPASEPKVDEPLVNTLGLCPDHIVRGTDPAPEQPEWDDKGLPPVGVECEYYDVNHKRLNHEDCNLDEHCIVDTWDNCDKLVVLGRVAKHDIEVPIVQNVRTQDVSTIQPHLIRLIRTERDKAVEEMIRAAAEAGAECDVTFAQAVYDAGYRKPDLLE